MPLPYGRGSVCRLVRYAVWFGMPSGSVWRSWVGMAGTFGVTDSFGLAMVGRVSLRSVRYFITFACYGVHLHGDESGSVDRNHAIPGSRLAEGSAARITLVRHLMNRRLTCSTETAGGLYWRLCEKSACIAAGFSLRHMYEAITFMWWWKLRWLPRKS